MNCQTLKLKVSLLPLCNQDMWCWTDGAGWRRTLRLVLSLTACIFCLKEGNSQDSWWDVWWLHRSTQILGPGTQFSVLCRFGSQLSNNKQVPFGSKWYIYSFFLFGHTFVDPWRRLVVSVLSTSAVICNFDCYTTKLTFNAVRDLFAFTRAAPKAAPAIWSQCTPAAFQVLRRALPTVTMTPVWCIYFSCIKQSHESLKHVMMRQ